MVKWICVMIFSSVRGRNTKRFPFGNGHGNFEVPIHWMNSFLRKEKHCILRIDCVVHHNYLTTVHAICITFHIFHFTWNINYYIEYPKNNSTLLNLMNLMDFKTTKNIWMAEYKIVLHKINIEMDHKNAMSYDVHTSSFSCLHFP